MIDAVVRLRAQHERGRVRNVGDKTRRHHAIDEHRRRLPLPHLLDDAIDAAAAMGAAEQALDAQHVVLAPVGGEPLAEQR